MLILRYSRRLHRRVVSLVPVVPRVDPVIFYECRVHGRVRSIVTIRHHPCCAVCHDTVIIRYKWTPTATANPDHPTECPPVSDRPRVSRHPGHDVSRGVDVAGYIR